MKVEILGPVCLECDKLAENAQRAIEELGVDAEIVRITDVEEMTRRGVMITPALAVDGELKSTGKVLSSIEIADHLSG